MQLVSGSEADIVERRYDVRFTPKSGHWLSPWHVRFVPLTDIRVDSEIRGARKLATSSAFSISPRYLAITSHNSSLFNRSNAPYRRGAVGIRGCDLRR